MTETRIFTWNKTAIFTLLVLVASIVIGTVLASRRIYLTPPLFGLTFYFYLLLALVPALITFVRFARRKPSGSRTMVILFVFFSGILLVFYLMIIGPLMFSNLACEQATSSGLVSHAECTCSDRNDSDSGPRACVVDHFTLSPFIQVHMKR